MMYKVIISLCVFFYLTGCAALHPGVQITDESLNYSEGKPGNPVPAIVHPITADLIVSMAKDRPANINQSLNYLGAGLQTYQYLIGKGDVLGITVWDHPELAGSGGDTQYPGLSTYHVAPDGSIFFPYVGKTKVSGRTVGAIRRDLTEALSRVIKDPQLDVKVMDFRSQNISVTGRVKKPGVIKLTDIPLTLLDAVNAAGGGGADSDLTRVSVQRGEKRYQIDLLEMLEKGDLSKNLLLRHQDIVNVPDRLGNKIFVIGEVQKPQVYLMHNRRMSLADALGQSGGADQLHANAERILVIRASEGKLDPEVFLLDANSPTALLLSTRFELEPLDVVYVSTSKVTRWNRLISQILPTVQGLYDIDRLSRLGR